MFTKYQRDRFSSVCFDFISQGGGTGGPGGPRAPHLFWIYLVKISKIDCGVTVMLTELPMVMIRGCGTGGAGGA